MNRTSLLLPLILLVGCSRASVPDLEDVPPAAQVSADAQAPGGTIPAEQAPGAPKLEERAPGKNPQTPDEHARAMASSTVSVELSPEQRTDIEKGVKRGVPNSTKFGSMSAKVSRFTSQSYIVCGWVDSGNGSQPFVAMYVPKMRNALLLGVGGQQPPDLIRQRCDAEGVALEPPT